MWGDDAARRKPGTGFRQQVEPVGVHHQGFIRRQRRFQHPLGPARLTQTRADGNDARALEQRFEIRFGLDTAGHDLGSPRVDGVGVGGAGGNADQSRAAAKRRLGSKTRGADISAVSADDQQVTESAFVGAPGPGTEAQVVVLQPFQPRIRRTPLEYRLRNAQIVIFDPAAPVRSVSGEQPLLQTDEAHRRRGVDRLTHHPAAVGVQPGGNIQRQNRHGSGVDIGDGRGPAAFHLAIEAGAENGVDDDAGAVQRQGRVWRRPHPGCLHLDPGAVGVAA